MDKMKIKYRIESITAWLVFLCVLQTTICADDDGEGNKGPQKSRHRTKTCQTGKKGMCVYTY